ncbi:MAG: hypothetical protein ACUVR2_09605 [Anaerolineae bacterium]
MEEPTPRLAGYAGVLALLLAILLSSCAPSERGASPALTAAPGTATPIPLAPT